MRGRCRVVCVLQLAITVFITTFAAGAPPTPRTPAKSSVLSYIYGSDKIETQAHNLLNCTFSTPQRYDPYLVLRKLYGPYFDINRKGKGSILVLGQHNSGTSMLARLLMLMGAFQGNVNGLSTSPKNRLKYWEKIDVTHFHDIVLGWISDKHFRPYHAQGVDMSKLTDDMKDNIKCFSKKIVQDLDRHRPWILKDPRMLLFADYWIEQMKDPVCVVVFRNPIDNAVSLANNAKKSAADAKFSTMTPEHWLHSWEEGMLHALRSCRDHPTVLLQLEDMQQDLMRFTYKLYAMLGQIGVYYLQMPTKAIMKNEFDAFLKPRHREEKEQPKVTMSRSQSALYRSLLMVTNSANMGLTEESMRSAAVLQLYEDALSYDG